MTKRILIVEDNHDLRSLLAAMLRFMGYQTIEAETGGQALQKAASENPDLILMDLGLPGMDGIDTARALKQNPTTARIPIIGQSARDHKLWRKVALEAGMVEEVSFVKKALVIIWARSLNTSKNLYLNSWHKSCCSHEPSN